MSYKLNKIEQRLLADIDKSYYMKPALNRINEFIKEQNNPIEAWKTVLDEIYHILQSAKDEVESILQHRKSEGKIRDIKQSMKSIAGHSFSNVIVYIFLQNKIVGNIKSEVFITSRKSQVKKFDDIATIRVGGETQKPDTDLIIFTQKANGDVHEC